MQPGGQEGSKAMSVFAGGASSAGLIRAMIGAMMTGLLPLRRLVRSARESLGVWLVALTGILVSLIGFGLLRQQLVSHEEAELGWVVHNRTRALEHGISRGLDAVRVLRDHFRVAPEAAEAGFASYARSLLERSPAVQTLLWQRWGERAAFSGEPVVESRMDGAPARLDLAADPALQALAERAVGTGDMTVSGRLAAASGERPAFLVLQPVERGGTLIGIVGAVFLFDELTSSSIGLLEPRGVACRLRDFSRPEAPQHLFLYASRLDPERAEPARQEAPEASRWLAEDVFPVADRRWSVSCAPTARYRSAEAFEEGPWMALAAGLLLTGVATFAFHHGRQTLLERMRLRAQAQRHSRLASVGVLAAGVAHEVNNPNNAIHFNASLLARAWHDATPILREYLEAEGDFSLAGLSYAREGESLGELVDEIGRCSERITRIVGNLKHLGREVPGDRRAVVDVRQVVDLSVGLLRGEIRRNTDHFEVHHAPLRWGADGTLRPPRVRGNLQELEQVFLNVILNALQSLPESDCGVSVTTRVDGASDEVLVEVRDEGRGIPKEELARVTEPFFSTRVDAGGTGLGLSISKTFVDKHGGRIDFASEVGAGTTVTVRLPALADGEETP